jgi:formyl-CoA transferase
MDKREFFRDARADRTGPLHGIRVVDLTTAWAGPMATCLLADLGADVVRIEPLDGGGPDWPPNLPATELSWAHQTVNRNKRSLVLDVRRPAGRDVFLELVRRADVVVENFKPGTLDRWGIGYERCRAVNDDVIVVSISGFGQFGPRSHQPGYDPGALATSGWMSLNGDPDGPPMKAPTFLADDLASLHAALGALAALQHRNATGEGQHVDVALLDALLSQTNGLLTLGALDVPLERVGNQVRTNVPCNSYRCTDGHVYLAIGNDAQWRRLVEAIGRPELAAAAGWATNRERVERRDEVDGLVAGWCASRSTAEVVAMGGEAGLVTARVNTFHEAARDPHVHERDMLQATTLSDGSTAPIVGPAAKFSRTPTGVRRPAPRSGAHTDEVLAEAGVDEAARAALRDAGIIA